MPKIFAGVDPGLNGAIALFQPSIGHLHVIDMPVVSIERNSKQKREVCAPALAAELRQYTIAAAAVERVNAMPGQGVSSVFSFGKSAGIIEGVLAGLLIPHSLVAPQAWQRALGVRDGKDGSRARACELFPAYAGLFARKKDDGRAEAALVAYYLVIR